MRLAELLVVLDPYLVVRGVGFNCGGGWTVYQRIKGTLFGMQKGSHADVVRAVASDAANRGGVDYGKNLRLIGVARRISH